MATDTDARMVHLSRQLLIVLLEIVQRVEDENEFASSLLLDVGANAEARREHIVQFAFMCAALSRIVLGVGAESEGEMAHRGGEAVAERLGTKPVTFPSGHGGFLGGEYGQSGEPDAFAARLREVLTEAA